MKITKRRAELRSKVLAACAELLSAGISPSGPRLSIKCPGHNEGTLVRVRNQLATDGLISYAELWPPWTDERSYAVGPTAHRWSKRHDQYRFELGRKPPRTRSEVARRAAVKNLGFIAEEVRS